MADSKPPKSSRDKVKAIARGSDARDFRAEAHRQSIAVAQSEQEALDQAFIDSVSDLVQSLSPT